MITERNQLARWEVDVKGKANEYYEISVIRSDNRYGHDSYGWNGKDKIIVSGSGGPCGYKVPPVLFDMLVKAARKYAKILNEAN